MNIIAEAKELLPQLDPAFERGAWLLHCGSPFLTDKFNQFVRAFSGDAIACTCSVLDVFAGDSLRYERNPGQRAFCMFFGQHPLSLGRKIAWTAIAHEAAHFLTDQSRARDLVDEDEAIKLWWSELGGYGEHNHAWCRAAMHLAYRAMTHGVPVAVDELLASAGFDECFMAGLRDELVSRADEPIENILASSDRAQAPAGRRPRKFPRVELIAGAPMMAFADGSVETIPDLRGEGGGERFAHPREFMKQLDRMGIA